MAHIHIPHRLMATAMGVTAAGGMFGFAFIDHLDEPFGRVVSVISLATMACGILIIPVLVACTGIASALRKSRRKDGESMADATLPPTTFRH